MSMLADKSAIVRFRASSVGDRYIPLLEDGLIATCPTIDLEVLYSARSLADYVAIAHERAGLPSYPVNATVTDRAAEVQHQLAARGQHRLPIANLLIAAIAELNDLTLLHYDADYDRISDVTGQPTEWCAPQGSL
jgi:predicted nucleic acid-binding protein